MDLLENLKGKTLEKTIYHEWTSDEFSAVDWVQLQFTDGSTACFSLSGLEETIDVLSEFDAKKEKLRLFELLDDEADIKTTDQSRSRKWKHFTGGKITGYILENGEHGRLNAVTLQFGGKSIRIIAEPDRLKVSVLEK